MRLLWILHFIQVIMPTAPNHFGTRDWLHRRQFFHGLAGEDGFGMARTHYIQAELLLCYLGWGGSRRLGSLAVHYWSGGLTAYPFILLTRIKFFIFWCTLCVSILYLSSDGFIFEFESVPKHNALYSLLTVNKNSYFK